MQSMGKTILVAGKDIPAGAKFADTLAGTGRYVVVTKPDDDEISENTDNAIATAAVAERHQKLMGKASGVAPVSWNKASPISSRTLILNMESIFTKMEEAVLYFDEEHFSSRANHINIEECAQTSDELILSYQYLTMEILARFEQKNTDKPGTLVFLLKDGPSASDAVKMPSLRNGTYPIASPLIASAAASFAAFAENIAALYGDLPFVNIILARGDRSTDIVTSEISLAKWLGSYMDAVESQTTKLNAKKSVIWVKPGSAFSVSTSKFSLFGKK